MGLSELLQNTFIPKAQSSKDTRICLVAEDNTMQDYIVVDEIIDFKYKSSVDSFTLIDITIPFETSAYDLKNASRDAKIFQDAKVKKKLNAFTDIFLPFSFRVVHVYYDNFKTYMLRGILLRSTPSVSEHGYVLNISISSTVSTFNDACFYSYSNTYEFQRATLKQITDKVILSPVTFIPRELATKYKFDKVAIEPTQTIFNFFTNIAKSEGILITDATYEIKSVTGIPDSLVFHKIKKILPTCYIREDEYPFISCSPSFNEQEFFAKVRCLVPVSTSTTTPTSSINPEIFDLDKDVANNNPSATKTENNRQTKNRSGEYPLGSRKDLSKVIAKNQGLKNANLDKHSSALAYRIHIFKAEASKNKTINAYNEAKAKYGRMLANAVNYQLVVQGHKNPKTRELYKKGEIINVYAPHSAIMQTCDFVIKELELNRTVAGGDTATLTLALTDAYLDEINIDNLYANLPFFKNDVNLN